MPTVEHSALTTSDLHEPKGVASATVSEVYVADGAGSGSWTQWPTGWGNYKDNNGTQVFNTTPALLSIDGAGSSTDTSHLPREIRGSGNLWNTTTDKITPIREGDAYEIRLDLPVTAETGSPTELILSMDINDDTYANRIEIVERVMSTGRSTPYTISVGFPVFVGSTFIANGAQIWLFSDAGTVTVTNPGIFITRLHDGSF